MNLQKIRYKIKNFSINAKVKRIKIAPLTHTTAFSITTDHLLTSITATQPCTSEGGNGGT